MISAEKVLLPVREIFAQHVFVPNDGAVENILYYCN